MSNFNYIEEAQKTLSNSFHGDLVARACLKQNLETTIKMLSYTDDIKKTLYYGKKNEAIAPYARERTVETLDLSKINPNPEKAQIILHAILGIATEAGELLEAVFKSLFEGKELDVFNVLEEVGDENWYEAILLKVLGSNFDEVQRTNIKKLRQRFPEKFSEEAANNRNLEAERKILEES